MHTIYIIKNKIRSENGDINYRRNAKIIRDNCEQLYSKNFEVLEEMDEVPNTYNLPKLSHESI
jgi:hypothetical protein